MDRLVDTGLDIVERVLGLVANDHEDRQSDHDHQDEQEGILNESLPGFTDVARSTVVHLPVTVLGRPCIRLCRLAYFARCPELRLRSLGTNHCGRAYGPDAVALPDAD